MYKRSQAALEFLTTYAWAFLVILIMIGALSYFGILNPIDLLPERCSFGSEFNCVDYVINYGTDGTDGSFDLRIKNSVGEPIILDDPDGLSLVLSSDAINPFSCSTFDLIDGVVGTSAYSWGTGETINIEWSGCNTLASGLDAGDKGKISIDINYYLAKSSAAYTHQVSGEIFTTVT